MNSETLCVVTNKGACWQVTVNGKTLSEETQSDLALEYACQIARQHQPSQVVLVKTDADEVFASFPSIGL